jgi:hypothetical protein
MREVLAMQSRRSMDEQLGTDANNHRSTLAIVKEIADDSATLIRKEAELARREIVEAVTARLKAAGALGAAGMLALMGILMCAVAGAAALSTIMTAWAAFLVVAGCLFVIAGCAALFARMRMSRPPLKPVETVRTVKEDVEWTKELLKR